MDKIYRVAIGAFLLIMGVIFFYVNFVLRTTEPEVTTGSDGPYLVLMILIASLVVVVVPGIFVLVRLTRR
ncbi:MAG: hypothetical protein ACW98F_08985 [Candidatus Hodarchaeales archaeon]